MGTPIASATDLAAGRSTPFTSAASPHPLPLPPLFLSRLFPPFPLQQLPPRHGPGGGHGNAHHLGRAGGGHRHALPDGLRLHRRGAIFIKINTMDPWPAH